MRDYVLCKSKACFAVGYCKMPSLFEETMLQVVEILLMCDIEYAEELQATRRP